MGNNLNLGDVVKGYREIVELEKEMQRRRNAVVKVMREKRVSAEDMASLLEITPSGVNQLVARYNKLKNAGVEIG